MLDSHSQFKPKKENLSSSQNYPTRRPQELTSSQKLLFKFSPKFRTTLKPSIKNSYIPNLTHPKLIQEMVSTSSTQPENTQVEGSIEKIHSGHLLTKEDFMNISINGRIAQNVFNGMERSGILKYALLVMLEYLMMM